MRNGLTRTRRSDEGFTLVELMVTVTIIGVLAAVSIPRYVSYVRSSQTAEVGQMAGAIVAAARAYADQQSLTPAATVTQFNTRQLIRSTTPPAAGTDLTEVVPQLSLQSNTNFDYAVSAVVAGAGAQSGEVVYCIKATGRPTAGVPGGVVLYSSTNAPVTATGWEGRVNKQAYMNGETGTTTFTAGGSCTTAGLAG